MKTTLARLSVATFAAFAVLVSPALAVDTINNSNGSVSFSDDNGDASTLTFANNPGGVVVSQTGGDMITGSGTGCQAGPATTITCTDDAIYQLQVHLNDMDDRATFNGTGQLSAYGGDGIDTLTGSDNNVRSENLQGEGGNDIIDTRNVTSLPRSYPVGDGANGGDGSDTITTGNGRDFVSGDDCCGPDPNAGPDVISTGPERDFVRPGLGVDQVNLGEGDDFLSAFGIEGFGEVLDGGPGTDAVQYSTYYAMLGQPADNFAVDLTAGSVTKTNDPSGSNTIPGFERAITGLGADTVVGTDGPNRIDTTDGQDTFFIDSVAGDGGGTSLPDLADIVNPKAGADEVGTGAGDDQIDSRDGYPDAINCGAGTDTVQADQFDSFDQCENTPITRTRAAGADTVPPNCKLSKVKGSYTRAAFTKGISARVTCDEPATLLLRMVATLKGGRGLTAKAGDLVLAERTAETGSNQAAGARLKPSKKLLKRFRKGRGLRVRVVVEARDEFGNRDLVNKRVKVAKAKRKRR